MSAFAPHLARGLRRRGPRCARLLRVSWPAAGERLLVNSALLIYFRVLSGYGPAAIAAYTIGVRLLAFSWIAPTGISIAASTLVGQALGARDPRLAARAGWRAARLSLLVVAAAVRAVRAAAHAARRELHRRHARCSARSSRSCSCSASRSPSSSLHFTLAGALRGAGDTETPLWSAIFGNWIFRVPLALLAAKLLPRRRGLGLGHGRVRPRHARGLAHLVVPARTAGRRTSARGSRSVASRDENLLRDTAVASREILPRTRREMLRVHSLRGVSRPLALLASRPRRRGPRSLPTSGSTRAARTTSSIRTPSRATTARSRAGLDRPGRGLLQPHRRPLLAPTRTTCATCSSSRGPLHVRLDLAANGGPGGTNTCVWPHGAGRCIGNTHVGCLTDAYIANPSIRRPGPSSCARAPATRPAT